MNSLLIGLSDKTQQLLDATKRPFLLIDDGPIADEFSDFHRRVTVFDPHKHSFDLLAGIDYKKARDIAALLYSLSPEGGNTLTVRNGRRALARMLLCASRFDRIKATNESEQDAAAMVDDVLFSPVLKRILCGKPNFDFSPHKTIVAKLDRAALGDFDALVLGNFLMGQYQGQIIVPDFGFYGRALHASIIKQNRLTAGVHFLAELEPDLRQLALLIPHKTALRCTWEDAEVLARYAGIVPGTTAHTDFIRQAIAAR